MQLFYSLVPLAAFSFILIYLGNRYSSQNLRQIILWTAIWFAVYLVFIQELLSLFRAVNRLTLVVAWILPVIAFGVWSYKLYKSGQRVILPDFHFPIEWKDLPLAILVLSIVVITLVVAWQAPPQTWDALAYHMSRIAHWAQNGSIGHYISGIERQNSMPPGAEMITLNTYVLSGSDRLSAFTQWFAMLGSLCAVSLIARHLGANTFGQWITVLAAAALPLGIVEASSTINDYAVTFWVVCAIAQVVAFYRTNENRCLFYCGLSTGLAVLTKPTSVPYLLPFGIWLAVLLLKRSGVVQTVKWGGIAILLILLINAGFLSRNLVTFGNISDPADLDAHNNELRTIPGLISTVVKNAATQAGFPGQPSLNDAINLLVLKIHVKLNIDLQDPRNTNSGFFSIRAPTTQEDTVTNPYQAALLLITFLLMFPLWKKVGSLGILYGILMVSSFILFSYFYKWNRFGNRYQLSFFIMFTPAVGLVFSSLKPRVWGYGVSLFLFLTCLPWLLSIDERPILPTPASLAGSIFTTPRDQLYFANMGSANTGFTQIANRIKNAGCTQIGLMLHGEDPEYIFWELMGAPRRNLNIQWIVAGTPSVRYKPHGFTPCAIICNACKQLTIRNLNLDSNWNEISLYMNPAGVK